MQKLSVKDILIAVIGGFLAQIEVRDFLGIENNMNQLTIGLIIAFLIMRIIESMHLLPCLKPITSFPVVMVLVTVAGELLKLEFKVRLIGSLIILVVMMLSLNAGSLAEAYFPNKFMKQLICIPSAILYGIAYFECAEEITHYAKIGWEWTIANMYLIIGVGALVSYILILFIANDDVPQIPVEATESETL